MTGRQGNPWSIQQCPQPPSQVFLLKSLLLYCSMYLQQVELSFQKCRRLEAVEAWYRAGQGSGPKHLHSQGRRDDSAAEMPQPATLQQRATVGGMEGQT
jgi:hypothetical protein